MTWQRDKPVQRRYKKGGVVLPESQEHRLISTSPQNPDLVFKGAIDKATKMLKMQPRKMKSGGIVPKATQIAKQTMQQASKMLKK